MMPKTISEQIIIRIVVCRQCLAASSKSTDEWKKAGDPTIIPARKRRADIGEAPKM